MSEVKLKDIATVIAGQSPNSDYYNMESMGLPFLQGNRTFGLLYPTIDTWTTKPTKIALSGSILLSVRAPVGDLNFANMDICIGRGLAAINANNKNNRFLYYALKYNISSLIQASSGTTFSSVNRHDIENLSLIIPKSELEQNIISKTLWDIDQKIAINNQINEELEAMAKTLYDYWFVQFDFPDENGKPYKSSGGKMVYNDQLKREIPEGWGVKCLGELDIATGKRDANFGTENGQYDFWTTANEPIKADEYSFEGKAILIAGNGNFYINFTEGKFEAYQRTYVIQSADENELLFMYPACLQSIEKLRKGSNGSIIKYITIGDVQNISQPYCPVIANMFVDIFRPIMNTIQKNKQQNQELTQLRDWLLPMLMNGQVKVEE
ncbi:TPA: restriction endonuclease subunit S [Streptococcus suis]|nr:restriction endonuclease subunit S [Streptococcus suis]HEM5174073.1 restriction endonuclease subunit S [Streptococcus suis]HEM5255707.1 restriction endonuclease subunit S [Streptococcus suis]